MSSFFVWCEWICSRCGNIHRFRYNVTIGSRIVYQLARATFLKNGVRIDDSAYAHKHPHTKKRKSNAARIYISYDTPIQTVIAMVKEYMYEYYAVKETTLKVEVCS